MLRPDRPEPVLMEPGLTESGSKVDFLSREPEPAFPDLLSFSRLPALYCRGIARVSRCAAFRWSIPARRSAWSSNHRKSETARSAAAAIHAFFESPVET